MTGRRIYHLTTAGAWTEARAAGEYRPASLDDEGFIHLSNREQVRRTFEKFYRHVPELVVLTVEVDRLGPGAVVDEPGDPGSDERFPHLYGPLPATAVVDVAPFDLAGWP